MALGHDHDVNVQRVVYPIGLREPSRSGPELPKGPRLVTIPWAVVPKDVPPPLSPMSTIAEMVTTRRRATPSDVPSLHTSVPAADVRWTE